MHQSHTTHKFLAVIGGDTNVRDVIVGLQGVSPTLHNTCKIGSPTPYARVGAAGPVFQSTGNSRGRMQCAESGRTCHSQDLNF